MGWRPPGEPRNVLTFRPRPRRVPRFSLFLPVLIAAFLALSYGSMIVPKPTFTGFVERVADGDSLYLHGQPIQIRLWGLDAPEWDTPGGPAATAALKRLAGGKLLTCEDMGRDRYQRILGRCYMPDGRSLTAAMIGNGTAREFVRYTKGYYWLAEQIDKVRSLVFTEILHWH